MKRKVNSKSQAFGFTLLEVVMVVFFVGIIGAIVVNLFIGQNRIYKIETAELNVTGDARIALDDIDNYVRQANRTLAGYSTYTAGPNVLILKIQSVNSFRELIPGIYDTIVYYLNGTSFYRQVFPDMSSARTAVIKKLASNVNSLNFTYSSADYTLVQQVTTTLTLQENAGVQVRALTISSQSTLRNY